MPKEIKFTIKCWWYAKTQYYSEKRWQVITQKIFAHKPLTLKDRYVTIMNRIFHSVWYKTTFTDFLRGFKYIDRV